MLEQQLNETRVRKQIEISEIDGRLNEEYEAKMAKSLNVSIYKSTWYASFFKAQN